MHAEVSPQQSKHNQILAMKAQPYKSLGGLVGMVECAAAEATHIEIRLPGPIPTRVLPVIQRGSRNDTGCWTWNGDVDKPTLKPSIKSSTSNSKGPIVCHTWITEGKVHFLPDCTHELAGQIHDLLDIDAITE